ncbi:MAG: DNA repair protein RecN [Bacteroidales bacterium]|nr:DNA repair protein RecN [Bacteroidales bacterium]
MLRSLSVSNYILIGSLDLEFPEGLVIISGETGAGKSILLGALSLVLGSKADSGMVGPHGENCVVEASFSIDAALRRVMEEKDIPPDGDSLLLRRVVSKSGRSRCFAGDEPVSVADLQEIASLLIDIHSQHQTLRLQDARFRTEALDLYAGTVELREKTEAAASALSSARRELGELRERKALALRDKEYNFSRWQRLEEARLVSGELEDLEARQKALAHAEEIKERLQEAGSILSEQRFKEAFRSLEKISAFIPSLEELAGRLESARVEIEDIEAEVERLDSSTEASPEALEQVEERLSTLYGLMHNYGASSLEELLAEKDRLKALVDSAETIEDDEAALEKKVKEASDAFEALKAQLFKKRSAAAGPFSSAIEEKLRFLDLENAKFEVKVGESAVDFLFSSTGRAPQDVAKAASGGELSRIMLSLKAMMAALTHMPALVFDEIDTGVSGSTADKMGSMVCSMGENMQVFAITHLPQVAAKGSAHYLVSKAQGVTSVRKLDAEGRVQEIARMLSGSTVTPEAIANAKSLLRQWQ